MGVAGTQLPVQLLSQHGEPLRLDVTSKEATGFPRGGLLCLIAVACGRDGRPLEGLSAGVSDPFEVPDCYRNACLPDSYARYGNTSRCRQWATGGRPTPPMFTRCSDAIHLSRT
jgi:hypothetical protein